MSTLSIPLSPDLEGFINSYIKQGRAKNKAQVVREALEFFAEEQAIADVLEAEREVADGKILRGDIKTLLKEFSS